MEIEHLDLGLDRDDVCELLANLDEDDFSRRVESELTAEWMYVFKPEVCGIGLYVKLIVRANCVVVSFHEDEEERADD